MRWNWNIKFSKFSDENQIETDDETEEEVLPVPGALIGSETELDQEPGTKKKLKGLKTQVVQLSLTKVVT